MAALLTCQTRTHTHTHTLSRWACASHPAPLLTRLSPDDVVSLSQPTPPIGSGLSAAHDRRYWRQSTNGTAGHQAACDPPDAGKHGDAVLLFDSGVTLITRPSPLVKGTMIKRATCVSRQDAFIAPALRGGLESPQGSVLYAKQNCSQEKY